MVVCKPVRKLELDRLEPLFQTYSFQNCLSHPVFCYGIPGWLIHTHAHLPARSNNLGIGQLRKRLDKPRNQPSQYFSVFASSILQVYGWSFLVWKSKSKFWVSEGNPRRNRIKTRYLGKGKGKKLAHIKGLPCPRHFNIHLILITALWHKLLLYLHV